MRLVAAMALVGLSACSQAAEPKEQHTDPAVAATPAAPPKSAAEALITKYTWPSPSQAAPRGKFAPRDECGTLDGAYEFRLALADAVLKRDADALVALADPRVELDFGGGEGRDELRLRLANPEWQLWKALEDVLALGCAATPQGGLAMPWYFTQDLGGDVFTTMIVTGEDVPLLADPAKDKQEVMRLSWDVVDLDPELAQGEVGEHARVLTRDGKSGWIAEENLRSVIDYRIVAGKTAGGWQMTAFIAGD